MEDPNVTGLHDGFGREAKKSLSINHCDNGFIVRYKTVNPSEKGGEFREVTIDRTRVFLDPTALIDFVASYFAGVVKP